MTSNRENRLAEESSPYLRQHAKNPVDWQPWDKEALGQAAREDKPIFLSIGYSACHWCHVMERESFENPEIANLLNQNFINIKVDREERPDLDQIYMAAVQALTGQGGWPMSVFLTPDLKPFFGGTYFPPSDRYGRPGFTRLILTLKDWWNNRREEILEQAQVVTKEIGKEIVGKTGKTPLKESMLENAGHALGKSFDRVYGGFGRAPKFPHPMDIRLLFRLYHRFKNPDFLHMGIKSLEEMGMGGIYDHAGGGFARYSTDEKWLVPHFEKMLYDNAQLLNCYLEGYQLTAREEFLEIIQDTMAWAQREMLSPEGLFFSTLDADSEGEEGKFYVWEKDEVMALIPGEMGETFCRVYGIETEGNWEGKNILHRQKHWEDLGKLHGFSAHELRAQCRAGLEKLFQQRKTRVHPGLDKKCLTSWNGLMIDALSRIAQATCLGQAGHLAEKCAQAVLELLKDPKTGKLFRTWSPAGKGKLNAYLEDYSFLITGLISLFECSGQARWLQEAIQLAEIMVEEFHDPSGQGFFFTGNSHEDLIHRPKEWQDNAIPSGNSLAVECLLKLGLLANRKDFSDLAWKTLEAFSPFMEKLPQAMGQMLCSLDFAMGPVSEWVWSADSFSRELLELRRKANFTFNPNQVSIPLDRESFPQVISLVPWLEGMQPEAKAKWYQCLGETCSQPMLGTKAIEEAIGKLPVENGP
ncbi:MAG: thioredoxin domain-containing protein [Gemmataceae bacterium]|nr:thioredoxin domain-containing protein [Gemmataceae bacterium]